MDVVPAWPPGATASIAMVRRPSDAAYTAAARPAGPAPTMVRSYSDNDGADTIPKPAATLSTVAGASRIPLGRTHRGSWPGYTSVGETFDLRENAEQRTAES